MGCSCSKNAALEPRRPGLPTLLGAVPKQSEPSDPKGETDAEKAQKVDDVEVSCHASAGAKWHLELLAVSAELKEKLQDPQFVATRCDLDGSGDLDAHELKQAARVYGISQSGSSENHDGTNPRLMAGQRVSKESFAEMVASQRSTKLIRAVPHSLRGMALGQLQHLEALFVTTGWLFARCESFNAENAHAIANRTKFRQDTNLYALDTFVVTPMSKPGMCGAREHDEQQTIAEARGISSFSQLVNPFGLVVHCFVSHFWGHNFASTVTALDLWADANYDKLTSEKEALVYWICLFALNQHDVAEEVGENPQQGPFNAALAQATGGAVMVLDEEVKPFSRIWCLFEASRLKDLQRPFELICSEGSLSQPENGGHKAVSTKMLETTCQALWNVSTAEAESSVAKDNYQIWEETANESIRGAIKGVGAELWFDALIAADAYGAYKLGASELAEAFSDFDRYMKSLLSTTVLRVLMARGDFASAATCCLQGADVSSEQLAEICSSFAAATQRRAWLNRMLLQASNPSIAKLLLEKGADARAADDDVTALMSAALGGHEAVAQLLLQHGADVAAASNRGTALMCAAAGGHEAVAQLLLQHGADVAAAKNDGETALMSAALGGHEAVAQLLLQHCADVAAASNDGITALMWAARGGHEAVAQLLLQHGADVAAAKNDGLTALMCAAQGGHEAMAQLLLQNGADVRAATNNGMTALMIARANRHEAVARLLREHGGDQNWFRRWLFG